MFAVLQASQNGLRNGGKTLPCTGRAPLNRRWSENVHRFLYLSTKSLLHNYAYISCENCLNHNFVICNSDCTRLQGKEAVLPHLFKSNGHLSSNKTSPKCACVLELSPKQKPHSWCWQPYLLREVRERKGEVRECQCHCLGFISCSFATCISCM